MVLNCALQKKKRFLLNPESVISANSISRYSTKSPLTVFHEGERAISDGLLFILKLAVHNRIGTEKVRTLEKV